MKIKLSELKPNPFRDMGHYPLDANRLESLKSSIEQTGFWDNVVMRKSGKEYQIAYGHHRLEAAKQILGGGYQADLPCRDLSDEKMLKMMIHENETIFEHRVDVLVENIKAVKNWFEGTEEGNAEYERLMVVLSLERGDTQQQSKVYQHFTGMNRFRVETALKLIKANIPEVEEASPSLKHAEAIIKIKDKRIAIGLARLAKEKGISYRPIESVVSSIGKVKRLPGTAEEKKERQIKVFRAALQAQKPADAAENTAQRIIRASLDGDQERQEIRTAEEHLLQCVSSLQAISLTMSKIVPFWDDLDAPTRSLFLKQATKFIQSCQSLHHQLTEKEKTGWPQITD